MEDTIRDSRLFDSAQGYKVVVAEKANVPLGFRRHIQRGPVVVVSRIIPSRGEVPWIVVPNNNTLVREELEMKGLYNVESISHIPQNKER